MDPSGAAGTTLDHTISCHYSLVVTGSLLARIWCSRRPSSSGPFLPSNSTSKRLSSSAIVISPSAWILRHIPIPCSTTSFAYQPRLPHPTFPRTHAPYPQSCGIEDARTPVRRYRTDLSCNTNNVKLSEEARERRDRLVDKSCTVRLV